MSFQTTHFRFAVARYTTAGDLDTTFSGDGKVVTDFPSNPGAMGLGLPTNSAGNLAAGPLQSIVLAGSADSGLKFALVRYTATGDLDTTFSGDGKVVTDFPQQQTSVASDAAIDGTGRIVVAGSAGFFFTPKRFAVARYTSDGTPDDSFSGNGRLTSSFPGTTSASGVEVAIDADGRIVVAGSATFGGSAEAAGTDRFAVARYTSSGDLDNSFSGDGRLTTTFPGATSASGHAVAIDANGRIVVAGSASFGAKDHFAIARYTTTGDLDNSFSGNGRLTTTFPSAEWADAHAVAIDANGRIVVAGSVADLIEVPDPG